MTSFKFAAAALSLALSAAVGSAFAAPVTIQPADGKDTQIVDGSVAGTNLGNSQFVIDNWVGNLRAIGLVEFDLSAYAGSTVTDAKFGLWHLFNGSLGTTYNVFRVTSAWDENTVTFNSAPTIDALAVATLTIGDALSDVYREWDLTALVNGWLAGTYANFGIWIEEVPIGGTGLAYFASSDYTGPGAGPGTDPYLKFNTAASGVPEPTTLLLVGAALMAAGAARRRAA